MASIGQGSIGLSPKVSSGAPFTLDSAANGLHVDPTTGQIFLGSVSASPNPKPLVENVNIDLALNNFIINDLLTGLTHIQMVPQAGVFRYGGSIGNNYLDFDDGNAAIRFWGATKMNFQILGNQDSVNLGDLQSNGPNPVILSLDSFLGDISASLEDLQGAGLFMRQSTQQFILGDNTGNVGNGTKVTVDNTANLVDVSNLALTASYSINGNMGASGTFTTADAKTVTVEGGIIISIV